MLWKNGSIRYELLLLRELQLLWNNLLPKLFTSISRKTVYRLQTAVLLSRNKLSNLKKVWSKTLSDTKVRFLSAVVAVTAGECRWAQRPRTTWATASRWSLPGDERTGAPRAPGASPRGPRGWRRRPWTCAGAPRGSCDGEAVPDPPPGPGPTGANRKDFWGGEACPGGARYKSDPGLKVSVGLSRRNKLVWCETCIYAADGPDYVVHS